jgi:predicted dehydrogenase
VSNGRPVRLGILGTGFISAVHAACAHRSDDVELVAIASIRGRAARDRVGDLADAVRLATADELLASGDVEAIVVCTRTADHREHAQAVLAAGKHLLLEKPGATTLTDQREIARVAAGHPDQVVRVAYHRRHDARFREIKRLIDSGAIGEPFAVQLASREDFPPSADDVPAGGFVLDVGVHDFDTARWFLGKNPTTAYAAAHNPVFGDSDLDNVYVTLTHDGSMATTHLSRTSHVGIDIRCEVIGPDGTIVFGRQALGGEISVVTAADEAPVPADCREFFPAAYQAQMNDFASACRGEDTANARLEDDYWAVAAGVATRASVSQRVPLEVGVDWEWAAPAVPAG